MPKRIPTALVSLALVVGGACYEDEAAAPDQATAGVAAVTVLPPSATMAVNDSGGFRAELRDAAGNVLTNRPISWFSSDTTVLAIVDSLGQEVTVRARARGSAVLRATSEGKLGDANILVN